VQDAEFGLRAPALLPAGAMMHGATAGDLAGRRILVVEDEAFLAEDLRVSLMGQGATVLGPAGTVADAIGLVERERVDFAILDLNLHGEMSFSVADMLAARGAPFLFATGYDGRMIPERFQSVDRFEKPFDVRDLIDALVNRPHPAAA
jgi:DNA-binding response OmpR family regulator